MRKITSSDRIFNRLIQGSDEIIYNLFYRIRSDADALLLTDDSYCIAACDYKRRVCSNILTQASDSMSIPYHIHMPLNVYACFQPAISDEEGAADRVKGHITHPKAIHRDQIAALIRTMSEDAENTTLDQKSA